MANILYPDFDVQAIFPEPILSAQHFDPGYSDHSTDVWKVISAHGVTAVRISCFEEWDDSAFWDGLRWLFSWRTVTARRTQARHRFLRAAGGLPVPQMLRHGRVGEISYLLMEWMPGQRCASFDQLSPAGLKAYGRYLAGLHTHTFPHTGLLGGAKGRSTADFPTRLAAVLGRLARVFFADQPDLLAPLAEMRERALRLRVDAFSPVLVDLCASQYLVDEQGLLCALIDTDAYVLAPRELDLINLEYLLTTEQAGHFTRGYTSLLPLPDLGAVRPVYRYLYRLMEVHDVRDLEQCLGWPAIF
jgi:fructosamine-3-kinase